VFWQHGSRIKEESRWLATNRLIKKWLRNRNQLLVVYNSLLGIPLEEPEAKIACLKRFCEHLIDYTAEGEFNIFVKLAEVFKACEQEHLPTSYHMIASTTHKFVDFNDEYARLFSKNKEEEEFIKEPLLDSLTSDLSMIGEQLADRLDAEDELVRAYLELTSQKKKDLSTSSRPLTF
jgi:regulator of sigma D